MSAVDDKLKDLIPLTVSFFQGESPTAEKLEGMMTQVEEAIAYLENTVGDSFNRTEYSTTWLHNYARLVGDVSKLNPIILPSYKQLNYTQQLTLGKTDHELDFIPLGSGSAILTDSFDSSVVVGQFKASTDLLEVPGDWTINETYTEDGDQKNEKRLITHSPSDGGTLVFAEVTTGKGSADEGARHNVIPSIAQAEQGGPFVDVVLADANTNTYTFTLPEITKQYDKTGDIVDVSLSNTSSVIIPGRNYLLPSYFFDANGLDLATDDTGISPEKTFPGNLINVYTWEDKQRVEGIIEVKASPVPSARQYQFSVRFEQDVLLDLNKSYLITVSGVSIADYIRVLTDFMINHNHAGEDMARHIKHSDLLDLRTSTSNITDRSRFYGTSNIDANDHSMYLHRDGFTDTDTGAGGNVMRGDLVVGNTDTGLSAEHENYNLIADSFALYFGHLVNSPKVFFEKAATHTTTQGRHDVAQTFLGEALKVIGPVHSSSGIKNMIIDAAVRVTKDMVLGSDVSDTVIVAGNMYLNQSATFIPLAESYIASSIPLEEGTVVYNDDQKELEYYNGNAKIGISTVGIKVLVGDGISSWGKYNGTDITTLQNAINEAGSNGGGVVRVLQGTYDLGFGQLSIPSNVRVIGSAAETVITGDTALVSFDSVEKSGIEDLVLMGRINAKASKLIDIENSTYIKLRGVDFRYAIHAVEFIGNCEHCRIESDCTFNDVFTTVRNDQTGIRSFTNIMPIQQPIGYTRDINMMNWGTKEAFAKKFVGPGSIATSYYEGDDYNTVPLGSMSGPGPQTFNLGHNLTTNHVIYSNSAPLAPTDYSISYGTGPGGVDQVSVDINSNLTGGEVITADYRQAIQSSVGRGVIKIDGTGIIKFDEMMPVSPSGGAGGFIDMRRIGAQGVASVGVECYDINGNSLGIRNFIANNVTVPVTMNYYYGTMTAEGANLTDFIPGTRFVRYIVNITQNDQGILMDNVAMYPMTISRLAVFA